MDNQSHPACECGDDQKVIRTANDVLSALSVLSRSNQICSLNMLVCAHLLVVYMRDAISDDPKANELNRQASAKAQDIYDYSQAHVEQTYGVRTTLSNKRGKLC